MSALSDKSNVQMEEQKKGDTYANGMTTTDAYQYLAGLPRAPIQPTR